MSSTSVASARAKRAAANGRDGKGGVPPHRIDLDDHDDLDLDDDDDDAPLFCPAPLASVLGDGRRLCLLFASSLLISASYLNAARFRASTSSSLAALSERASAERSPAAELHRTRTAVPFVMCDRRTPHEYDVDPSLPPAERKPLFDAPVSWEKDDKILLLRNDGKFGHVGNQFNSLLHAFDYARDHRLHLGMLFHSWAMDVISGLFYESDDFDVLSRDLMDSFGVLVVRNRTQLEPFAEVISHNSQMLFFYRSKNAGMDGWKDGMAVHAEILRRLYLRYNRGYGYVHTGLRARDVCGSLETFFRGQAGEVKYTVIHSRYMEGNAEWRLGKIAKKTGITIEGGALYMGPAYIKAILKPLGMLEYPIILLTDGQLPSVERGLFNDPVIGPNLMVLGEKDHLNGEDVALAVLSDVFVGNPASVTSGFIARSRVALGYDEKSTHLFRRKRIHQWYSVCNSECVFNPWILDKWV